MLNHLRRAGISIALMGALSGAALAQETSVAFGGLRTDPTLPVEATADRLSVNQTDGTAVFEGNVVIIQGEMRLSAPEVRVTYATGDRSTIESMQASGGVLLVSGDSAAEGAAAEYSVTTGTVVLTGDVLLTQGQSTMAGNKLTVNLGDGTGVMEGRVRTILQPKGN